MAKTKVDHPLDGDVYRAKYRRIGTGGETPDDIRDKLVRRRNAQQR